MASTVTVTGKVGPGITATATVVNNVTSFAIDTVNEILSVFVGPDNRQQFDITAATTITCTVSGNNYTLTIS